MKDNQLLTQLFRTEFSKIVSVLYKSYSLADLQLAEDIVSYTFLKATETWGLKGIPENPKAWLYSVAKNKTKDYFKHNKLFSDKISIELKHPQNHFENVEIDLSNKNIADSQLQMIFAISNPTIAEEAQIGLALRILCGFGIEEIAKAFLTNKETINKRLYRAKEKLRNENVKIETPNEEEINQRLETVLNTIYLLFNEGYHSSTKNTNLRKELCLEAMRLNYFLINNKQTNKPIVNALMSLMCFHSSRFEAKKNQFGEQILYDDQDKSLWNNELIEKGNYYLVESAKGQEISKYHLEASIAYWHSAKTETPNKWGNILQLYNQLLQIEYSPISALNRTYAISKTKGKEEAIKEALKIKLLDNHFYHSLLGYLYTDIDNKKAITQYTRALELAKTRSDKIIVKNNLNKIKKRKTPYNTMYSA